MKCTKQIRSGSKYPICKECSGGKIIHDSSIDSQMRPVRLPVIILNEKS